MFVQSFIKPSAAVHDLYTVYIHLYSPKLVAIQQTNYKHNTTKEKILTEKKKQQQC